MLIDMDITESNKLHIDEILFYLMLFCFMGSKAIGLSEGQWPFSVAIIAGFVLFVGKMFFSGMNVLEWIVSILLLSLGGVVYLRNGHIEVLTAMCIVIGMKNIPMKRATNVALAIWGPLFALTIIRGLLGFYPGYIGTQMKTGMSSGILRYSLGFTHPNVLHITYFIVVLLILFYIRDRKKLLLAEFILFIGNLYIFMYSVSYTGFIVVSFCLIINIYSFRGKKTRFFETVLISAFITVCFIFLIIGGYILPDNLVSVIDKLINNRISLTKSAISQYGISMLGIRNTQMNIPTLDSSFVYILFYHGIVTYLLFFVGFMVTTYRALKKNDRKTVSLFSSMALSGITEQYLGNISFKNLSLLFIGDCLYNDLLLRKNASNAKNSRNKTLSIEWFSLLKKRLSAYFSNTPWLKCILPGVIMSFAFAIAFHSVWVEPRTVYVVPIERDLDNYDNLQIFHEADRPKFEDSIVILDLYEGCKYAEFGWVDVGFETTRGYISSVLWGFIIGFLLSAYIFNTKKINTVYIEDPITAGEGSADSIPKCRILNTDIAVTNMSRTLSFLMTNIDKLRGKYICVSNVHTTVMSYRDNKYNIVQNNAALALPDGKPLSYVSRRRGYIQADRVAGPDLMTEIFRISSERGYRHFFFGSTEDTLNKLKDSLLIKYPGITIAGMCSPDYYEKIEDIPKEKDEEYVKIINEAKPDFIWVGLGAPKQELWMAAHEDKLTGIMLGVGAGFDFHAGTIKRAPKILQALYLEWLYRLFQDPKRLIKRYFSTNFAFIKETYKERKTNKKAAGELRSQCKNRLLIYAHYYAPDVASTGQILTELAEGLLDKFEVTVIAVVPSYSGKIEEKYKNYRFYQQDVRGVKVVRVRVPEFTKISKLSRARNIAGYYFMAKKVTKKVGDQDYILSISQPPILGGMLGRYGAKIKKAKFIYNIQDFNPEQIESINYSKNKLLIEILRKIDISSCKRSDLIITVGRDLAETIERRFDKETVPRYTVINNWIDEEKIYPIDESDDGVKAFKERYDLTGKFVFMYSGNLGLYYDLENLIKVIKRFPVGTKTNSGKEVVFAFVGNGGLKEKLENYVQENGMSNVIFIPYQDKDELIYSLNAGDVHICVNAKGIKGVSCPSKYYGIAAAGKPIIASLEDGSEIRCLIEETDGGLVSDPEDHEHLYDNFKRFIEMDAESMEAMGERSRNNLLNRYKKDISIEKYKEAILEL